jgi:ketosteroid isomerase-like protein
MPTSAALLGSVRGTLFGMDERQEVIEAAFARATALAEADASRLLALLHDDFRWMSHFGETFNRREYIARNTEGHTVWRSQHLNDAEVVVVGDTAVLYAEVIDTVRSGADGWEMFRMPMTQVWVRQGDDWKCLAGHAGPRRT